MTRHGYRPTPEYRRRQQLTLSRAIANVLTFGLILCAVWLVMALPQTRGSACYPGGGC